MAVTPLYSSREDLLKKVRMTTATDEQTLAVVDMAMTEVRLEMIAALGSDRVTQIAGYQESENPSTQEEILRAMAAVAEILWVTAKLVEHLPVLFINDAAKAQNAFNDEPLTRDSVALAKYKSSLITRVEKLIGKLKVPEKVSGNGQVFSCGAVDADGEDDPYILAEHFIGLRMV